MDYASVWILGHAVICLAQKRAAFRQFSEFNNFERHFVTNSFPPPNTLIIHVSGKFIGKMRTIKPIEENKSESARIHELLHDSVIIFSEIFPKLSWTADIMEKIRKRVNRCMYKFITLINGFSFRHIDLEGFIVRFDKAVGVNHTSGGMYGFL